MAAVEDGLEAGSHHTVGEIRDGVAAYRHQGYTAAEISHAG